MKDFLNQRPAFFRLHQSVRRRREGHPARVPFFICIVMMVLWLAVIGAVRMGAGSKPLRPWQVCAGDVIGSGKRVEYVFERYGELYINASDEELVRQGKRTYGEELTRLYDLDLSGWRVIGHYGCGRGYEGRSWYDMGKPFGRR